MSVIHGRINNTINHSVLGMIYLDLKYVWFSLKYYCVPEFFKWLFNYSYFNEENVKILKNILFIRVLTKFIQVMMEIY